MQINLNYKIDDRGTRTTLDIIREVGYDSAMSLAYAKALSILEKDKESILSVMLLAWSHNLLTDARRAEGEKAEELQILASFFRKLAHKVYRHQRQDDSIARIPSFIQSV